PPADVHGGGGDHRSAVDDRKLGRSAANIDIEYSAARLVRYLRSARAVGGQHRFHVMSSGRADEVTALARENIGNRLCVLAPQCLAGEDNDPSVDVARLQMCGRVGAINDDSERAVVDA